MLNGWMPALPKDLPEEAQSELGPTR